MNVAPGGTGVIGRIGETGPARQSVGRNDQRIGWPERTNTARGVVHRKTEAVQIDQRQGWNKKDSGDGVNGAGSCWIHVPLFSPSTLLAKRNILVLRAVIVAAGDRTVRPHQRQKSAGLGKGKTRMEETGGGKLAILSRSEHQLVIVGTEV